MNSAPNRWMIALILIAIAIPIAHAEKYYVLTAHLAGHQIVVSSVKMENVPLEVAQGEGEYLIEIASMRHEVLYSGRYELGSTPTALYIPYDIDGNYLNIKKSTGEVLQRVSVALFSIVCGDSLCQSSETAENCMEDCADIEDPSPQETLKETSATIINETPKIAQIETTAQTTNRPVVKKPTKKNMAHVIIVGGILGVVLVSGGFLVILKKAKEERLGSIREYLRRYAYYPPDQVKQALLMRGVKEEDIKEALRQN